MPSDSSRPPSVDPRATLHGADETLEQRHMRYRADAKSTAAELVTLTDRVEVLEELVGRAPSALPGDKGSGLAQLFVDLTAAVGALRDELRADREGRARDAAAMAERRAPWGRVSWIAAGAAITVAAAGGVQAVLHWLATLHH